MVVESNELLQGESHLWFGTAEHQSSYAATRYLNTPWQMNLLNFIGGLAAALTSLSYLPQVKKAWPRRSTKDLSLVMLIVLTSGLWLWTVYGFLKDDWVIIAANIVGGTLSLTVLLCKLRDLKSRAPAASSLKP